MAIDVVTLTICGTGVFSVRGGLAAIGSVNGSRRAAEGDIHLGIYMGGVVGDGHGTVYCTRMACTAAYGVQLGRIDMSGVTTGGYNICGSVIGLMASFTGQTTTPGSCLVRCIKSTGLGSGAVTVRCGTTSESIFLTGKIIIQGA